MHNGTDATEEKYSSSISSIRLPLLEFGEYMADRLIVSSEKQAVHTSDTLFFREMELNHDKSITMPASLQGKHVVVVGAINMDFTFYVDHLPCKGNTTVIRAGLSAPGGKGLNQAVAVARLGQETVLIGEVGSDTESVELLNLMEKENIRTEGIKRCNGSAAGKAYIYREPNGESAISILHGANSCLSAKDIFHNEYLFHNCGYCLLSTEISLEVVIEAARMARKNHAVTLLKPSALKELPEELISCIDYLIPNRKEAAILASERKSPEMQADYFFSLGIPNIIITLGKHGCYLRTDSVSKFYPASKTTALDTTGGADAFIGALTYSLNTGFSVDCAIRIASRAAGFCVEKQGTATAMIDLNSLGSLLSRFSRETG